MSIVHVPVSIVLEINTIMIINIFKMLVVILRLISVRYVSQKPKKFLKYYLHIEIMESLLLIEIN